MRQNVANSHAKGSHHTHVLVEVAKVKKSIDYHRFSKILGLATRDLDISKYTRLPGFSEILLVYKMENSPNFKLVL